ncbi:MULTISPECIES: terpene synthase family protein [Streptomyces]|uniref:terpene synthase family protein n=1 Tax=Streptomyces TaxID=1883 RepID=UPI00163BE13E|nr:MULTISPECIES: hypothetical protein [Streptomyces]MBC2878042.1 hypothetical protein [Streptomyces sp. TYQ1024]UBI39996.1 hypothetical protein K7I03_28370 [Streptomyces mobaraensis]UKW32577.1 hypothetical protein MCU78_28300 [Streptomyces sp. TYQ1024]
MSESKSSKLTLPLLYYPFPVGVSSDLEAVEAEALQWAIDFGLTEFGVEREEQIRDTKCAEFIGRLFHTMPPERFRVAAIWCTWIFVIDASFCEAGIYLTDPAELAAFQLWLHDMHYDPKGYDRRPLCEELASRLPAEHAELCRRLAPATVDVSERVERLTGPGLYMQWLGEMNYWYMSTLWQVGRPFTGTRPSVRQWLSARRALTAILPTLAAWPAFTGSDVPEHEWNRADVRRLMALTSDIGGMFNDIISFPREKGVIWSLPIILADEGRNDQEAVNEAVRLHNNAVTEYLSLERDVRKRASPGLCRFLDAMRTHQRGQYEWSIRAGRYRSDENYEIEGCIEAEAST